MSSKESKSIFQQSVVVTLLYIVYLFVMLLFIKEYVKGFTLTNLSRFNISLNFKRRGVDPRHRRLDFNFFLQRTCLRTTVS